MNDVELSLECCVDCEMDHIGKAFLISFYFSNQLFGDVCIR